MQQVEDAGRPMGWPRFDWSHSGAESRSSSNLPVGTWIPFERERTAVTIFDILISCRAELRLTTSDKGAGLSGIKWNRLKKSFWTIYFNWSHVVHLSNARKQPRTMAFSAYKVGFLWSFNLFSLRIPSNLLRTHQWRSVVKNRCLMLNSMLFVPTGKVY